MPSSLTESFDWRTGPWPREHEDILRLYADLVIEAGAHDSGLEAQVFLKAFFFQIRKNNAALDLNCVHVQSDIGNN